MKIQLSLYMILLFFLTSCNDDLDLSHLNRTDTEEDLFETTAKGQCFDQSDFGLGQGDLVTSFVYKDKVYLEYTSIATEAIPILAHENQRNAKLSLSNRELVVYNETGSKESYFLQYKGLENEIGGIIGNVSLTNIPKTFNGEIVVFDKKNRFVEMKQFEKGKMVAAYSKETESTCNNVLSSRGDGECITVFYSVPRLSNKVTTIDWYNTSGNNFEHIGVSHNYETFPSVFHESFTWCPDMILDFIPTGDDGGVFPTIVDAKKCINAVSALLSNGFHDPCQPNVPGHEVILEAIGGWGGCKSEEFLLEKLNESLGNGSNNEVNLDFDDMAILNQLPDDVGCYIVENAEDSILNVTFVVEQDWGEIINLNEKLNDCFGEPDANGNRVDCDASSSASFNMTLYVDQPVPHSREVYAGPKLKPNNVGHTFVSLTRIENGAESTMVFGLYPGESVTPFSPNTERAIVTDEAHPFDIGLSMDINCDQFNSVLNEASNIENADYNLNSNNCTDFALNLVQLVNPNIPDTKGVWGAGAGSNPADLGEDLRDFLGSGTKIERGFAPFNKCN